MRSVAARLFMGNKPRISNCHWNRHCEKISMKSHLLASSSEICSVALYVNRLLEVHLRPNVTNRILFSGFFFNIRTSDSLYNRLYKFTCEHYSLGSIGHSAKPTSWAKVPRNTYGALAG